MLLMDKEYLTEKEASKRYGYSKSWFCNKRYNGHGPDFIKLGKGRVLYPLAETDSWFKKNLGIK